MKDLTIVDFPHTAPEGYSYEFEQYNSKTIRIMLRCHRVFDYNNGKSTSTVWGFYNPKKSEYYSPINATAIGSCVDINSTRPWTSMPIKMTPLEAAFNG